MTERKIAPYGSWASPITVEMLLKGAVHMRNQMVRWDGDDVYWSELRPDEAGRMVVCRRGADGTTGDVTPRGFHARTPAGASRHPPHREEGLRQITPTRW